MFAVNLTVVIMVSITWNKFSQSIDHSRDGFHLQCTLASLSAGVGSVLDLGIIDPGFGKCGSRGSLTKNTFMYFRLQTCLI